MAAVATLKRKLDYEGDSTPPKQSKAVRDWADIADAPERVEMKVYSSLFKASEEAPAPQVSPSSEATVSSSSSPRVAPLSLSEKLLEQLRSNKRYWSNLDVEGVQFALSGDYVNCRHRKFPMDLNLTVFTPLTLMWYPRFWPFGNLRGPKDTSKYAPTELSAAKYTVELRNVSWSDTSPTTPEGLDAEMTAFMTWLKAIFEKYVDFVINTPNLCQSYKDAIYSDLLATEQRFFTERVAMAKMAKAAHDKAVSEGLTPVPLLPSQLALLDPKATASVDDDVFKAKLREAMFHDLVKENQKGFGYWSVSCSWRLFRGLKKGKEGKDGGAAGNEAKAENVPDNYNDSFASICPEIYEVERKGYRYNDVPLYAEGNLVPWPKRRLAHRAVAQLLVALSFYTQSASHTVGMHLEPREVTFYRSPEVGRDVETVPQLTRSPLLGAETYQMDEADPALGEV